MGIHLDLVNFDELFFIKGKNSPVIVNDFADTSKARKEAFNAMIYTKYAGDLLSNLPKCSCGETVGEYNAGYWVGDTYYPGVICRICLTEVRSSLEQTLEPLVWMRAPKGIDALISPLVWTMLTERFTKSDFDIIRWFCDTRYDPQVKQPYIMREIMELPFERGYNNFVRNFDAIMEVLFSLKKLKLKKGTPDNLQQLLKDRRDCVFAQYLPFPNKALLVLEETNMGAYADAINEGIVDAINTMVGIDAPLSTHSVRTKENRTVKTIIQVAQYHDNVIRNTLSRKQGAFRKHAFGTRSHFSFRAVISSLTNDHDYDELHIPWGVGVSLFRIHLLSKLIRRDMLQNEAMAFLNAHAHRRHPLLEQLFQDLIAECPYKGIPVIFQRNPSLERGSAQAMYVTRVKLDVGDPTVSLSILSVHGFNADEVVPEVLPCIPKERALWNIQAH